MIRRTPAGFVERSFLGTMMNDRKKLRGYPPHPSWSPNSSNNNNRSRTSFLGHHVVSRFLVVLWIILILAVVHSVLLPSVDNNSFLLRKSSELADNTDRCRILETSTPSHLASLVELDLKDCRLSSLSNNIQHCTNLQKLDISSNPELTTLPDELRQCTQLEILFSSSNPGMTVMPTVLGQLSSLTRLGWRSGSITALSAVSLPPNVVHLILTDNQIQRLDDDDQVWERLRHVRKLMLSHNQIQSLSSTGIAKMVDLELLRLAGNQLTSIPNTLWSLPKLCWLTISGNPGLGLPRLEQRVPTISLADVSLVGNGEESNLGAGASGSVTARIWQGREVAVKTIHGVTSDGRAEDELQMYGAVGSNGMKHRVVGCLAVFQHDNGKSGTRVSS